MAQRVLFFLPNIRGYLDRARLLAHVSSKVDRLFLLVGRRDDDLDTDQYPNLQVVDAGFTTGLRALNMLRSIRLADRLIKTHQVTVVHDTFATLLPLMWLKHRYPGVRFVESFYILNGWRLRHVWDRVPAWRLAAHRSTAMMYPNAWLEKLACAAADRIVLQAPGLSDQLLEYTSIPTSRISVLPNNVDTGYWRPPNDNHSGESPSSAIRLFSAAGIDRTRGAFVMLDVMRALIESGVNARLTMAGAWGPFDRRDISRTIAEQGLADTVALPGRLSKPQIRAAFWSHDLFLYQTVNDGSPRVVLEAMACGIPIIASHHPGIDILDPAGEWLAFTHFGSVGAIADFVMDYAINRNAWRARAARGALQVNRQFGTESVADQYATFYDGIAGP